MFDLWMCRLAEAALTGRRWLSVSAVRCINAAVSCFQFRTRIRANLGLLNQTNKS